MPQLKAFFAFPVFRWATLGAVRGAEEEASSTERRAGQQPPAFTQRSHCSQQTVVVVAERNWNLLVNEDIHTANTGLSHREERSGFVVVVRRGSVFQFARGKVLIPNTLKLPKRWMYVMNTTRDYFPILLVLVWMMTDIGAKGKNCLNISPQSFFFYSLCVVHECSHELLSLRPRYSSFSPEKLCDFSVFFYQCLHVLALLSDLPPKAHGHWEGSGVFLTLLVVFLSVQSDI